MLKLNSLGGYVCLTLSAYGLTVCTGYGAKPALHKTYMRIQKFIEKQTFMHKLNTHEVLNFFSSKPPQTAEGWIQYGTALKAQRTIPEELKEHVREFWIQNALSAEESQRFLKVWSKVIRSCEHEKKMIYLLSTNTPQNPSITCAQDILDVCRKDFSQNHELRIATGLLSLDPTSEKRFLQKKIRNYFSPILHRAYLRFLMRTERLEDAFKHWAQWKQKIVKDEYTFHQDLDHARFFSLRTLARDLVQLGNTFEAKAQNHLARRWYSRAAQVMAHITPEDGNYSIENSWLAGFIQVNLQHWNQALKHFVTMSRQAFSKKEHVVNSLSRERYHAKALFWAGICAQKLMRIHQAKNYFEAAAQYPFLFYGQMALVRLKRPLVMQFASQANPHRSHTIQKVLSILDQPKISAHAAESGLVNTLLDDLMDHFSSSKECWAFLDILRQRFPSAAVYLARKLSAHRARYVFPMAYPTCPLPRSFKDPALVWSIALGETCFSPTVVSSKGALGVMQIMPAEVPHFAKKAGLVPSLSRMKEFNYGMSLGIEELKEKLSAYQQKYVLGIASYNAGRKKLDEWRSSLYPCVEKDPILRTCIWIERIPYEETRAYIPKILSFYTVYRWMQGNPLKTSADVAKLLAL